MLPKKKELTGWLHFKKKKGKEIVEIAVYREEATVWLARTYPNRWEEYIVWEAHQDTLAGWISEATLHWGDLDHESVKYP